MSALAGKILLAQLAQIIAKPDCISLLKKFFLSAWKRAPDTLWLIFAEFSCGHLLANSRICAQMKSEDSQR